MKLKKIDLTNYIKFYWKRAKQRVEYFSIKIKIMEEGKGLLNNEETAEKFYVKYGESKNVRLVLSYRDGTTQTWYTDSISFDRDTDSEVTEEKPTLSLSTVGDSNLLEEKFDNLNYNLDDENFDLVVNESITTRDQKISRILEIEQFLTTLVIGTRNTEGAYRPAQGDKYQHLRDEMVELRADVFKDKNMYPPSYLVEKTVEETPKKKGPTASVTSD
ncbi:MAG: hypothetical protein SLAVMIC_00868 [uncultured marine phage]|uniref:Uncharacterized protein n=1 Tax=uncultured marine phage TaxID=707152 RepID=A0A8D9FQL1_9VIRU|nr:MAG: hypothetical protein SLAVMIC_00868 [uncultured marine phage]